MSSGIVRIKTTRTPSTRYIFKLCPPHNYSKLPQKKIFFILIHYIQPNENITQLYFCRNVLKHPPFQPMVLSPVWGFSVLSEFHDPVFHNHLLIKSNTCTIYQLLLAPSVIDDIIIFPFYTH